MSDFETRKASSGDVERIGTIIQHVWPESAVSLDRILAVVEDPDHASLVIVAAGQVAGFVDGFSTTSIDGIKRWEVDLLAVDPAYQRRGMGAYLVNESTQQATVNGAAFARGLVAVDNVGSEKAFGRCGYVTDGVTRVLLVASASAGDDRVDDVGGDPFLIPVRTMNYTGLWVEGVRNRQSLQAATSRMKVIDCDLVGTVVSEAEADLVETAKLLGYEEIGRFRWWERPIGDR